MKQIGFDIVRLIQRKLVKPLDANITIIPRYGVYILVMKPTLRLSKAQSIKLLSIWNNAHAFVTGDESYSNMYSTGWTRRTLLTNELTKSMLSDNKEIWRQKLNAEYLKCYDNIRHRYYLVNILSLTIKNGTNIEKTAQMGCWKCSNYLEIIFGKQNFCFILYM